MLYRSLFIPFFFWLTAFGVVQIPTETSKDGFCSTFEIQDKIFTRMKENLASDYSALCEAIKADNSTRVKELLDENPMLKDYSERHEGGNALELVKSEKMARFLVAEGFSSNICDRWGQLPSETVAKRHEDSFAAPNEKQAIIEYYKAREGKFAKAYYQLTRNKPLQITALLTAAIIALFSVDVYLLKELPRHEIL